MQRIACLCAASIAAWSISAHAQDPELEPAPVVTTEPAPARIMIELTGAYGFQFGTTDYLPDESPMNFKHPFVSGFTFGGTVGYGFVPDVFLVLNYDYTRASSVTGSITTPPILDDVEGSISFQTIALGLRLARALGPGRLHAEFALGVLLPYETEVEYTYGAGLAPAGITGTGTFTREWNMGFGGHGVLGYTFTIADRFYVGPALKAKTYVTNNDDKKTRFENFVQDFTAQPAPTATTAEIENTRSVTGAGQTRPTTSSVQDLRLQLAIGARF